MSRWVLQLPIESWGELFLGSMKYRDFYKKYFAIQFDDSFDIHHINGDRKDNDISNLVLIPKILHQTLHKVLYDVSFCQSPFDYILVFSKMDEKTFQIIKDLYHWIDLKEQSACEKDNSIIEGRKYINFYQAKIEEFENRIETI